MFVTIGEFIVDSSTIKYIKILPALNQNKEQRDFLIKFKDGEELRSPKPFDKDLISKQTQHVQKI